MLFLAGADHERYGKVKWTRRYLLGHRRILKKGDFTIPPVDPIFQKENGGSDFSKPPLCRYGAKVGLLHDGFFLCRRAADKLL